MKKLLIRSGDRYGRLTILGEVESNNRDRKFECICDPNYGGCGNKTIIYLKHLRSGHTISCKCFRVDRMVTHGLSREPLYSVWKSMIDRCYNANDPAYRGRGVVVCSKWRDDPVAFIKWAKVNGWRSGLEIDKDIIEPGNLLYAPHTCCFVTPKVNGRCTRQTVWVDYYGKEIAFSEAHELSGSPVSVTTARNRYQKLGWSLHDALTIPVRKGN